MKVPTVSIFSFFSIFFLIPSLFFTLPKIEAESKWVEFLGEWGVVGTLKSQFIEPTGITFLPEKNLIAVADRGNHRIQLFQVSGIFSGIVPTQYASGPFSLYLPESLVHHPDGTLIVANTGLSNIHIYDSNFKLLRVIGKRGWKNGYFLHPSSVSLSPEGNIVTLEPRGNFISGIGLDFFQKQRVQGNRAQVFKTDGSFIQRAGHMHRIGGRRIRQLNSPKGVFVDKDGFFWFADTGNHRILKYKSEEEAFPIHPEKLCHPESIYQDIDGKIFLTDTHNHRILILKSTGELLTYFGRQGSNPGEFSFPREVVVVRDRLYVCDRMNHRIQVFNLNYKNLKMEKEKMPALLSSNGTGS